MKATCDQLSAFADGELSEQQHHLFQMHLARCGECSRALGDQWTIEHALRARGVHLVGGPSAPLVGRGGAERRLVGLALALLFAAAVVAMVLAGGLW